MLQTNLYFDPEMMTKPLPVVGIRLKNVYDAWWHQLELVL